MPEHAGRRRRLVVAAVLIDTLVEDGQRALATLFFEVVAVLLETSAEGHTGLCLTLVLASRPRRRRIFTGRGWRRQRWLAIGDEALFELSATAILAFVKAAVVFTTCTEGLLGPYETEVLAARFRGGDGSTVFVDARLFQFDGASLAALAIELLAFVQERERPLEALAFATSLGLERRSEKQKDSQNDEKGYGDPA